MLTSEFCKIFGICFLQNTYEGLLLSNQYTPAYELNTGIHEL